MKTLLTIFALTLFATSTHAQAPARYMPNADASSFRGAVNNPQPVKTAAVPNYRPQRIQIAAYSQQPRIPTYSDAAFRDARVNIPRNNIRMPRSFRIDWNPAGRTPR